MAEKMAWAPRPSRSFSQYRNGTGGRSLNPSHPKYRDDSFARELSDHAKDREVIFRAQDAKDRGNEALSEVIGISMLSAGLQS